MLVIDSSAWIEMIAGPPLAGRLRSKIPNRSECIVPTIVQLELAKWLKREMSEDQALIIIGYTQRCVVAPLDTATAVHAADLSVQHKLSIADAVIYATARIYQADLLTCDAHFEGLPRVIYLTKNGEPPKLTS